jgi:hypothetical protein
VIAYPAMLDVPRELVREVASLLRALRRARGTRKGSRALTCWYQALMVLAWFRDQGDTALVGAGFGVSRATAYRYRDEVITALAEQAPDLHEALEQVAEEGWAYVVLDGKVLRTDRCAETTTSTQGETINAWYSVKHRAPGGNVQAIIRPDGLPIWLSDVEPGHRHDMACARNARALAALYWSASQLDLPTLADSGYEGAGQGIHTPIKQPPAGRYSPRTTRPTTFSCGRPAASANAASPCSPAAGAPCDASPPALAESATTPKPHSSSPTSNNCSYALLVEITSICDLSMVSSRRTLIAGFDEPQKIIALPDVAADVHLDGDDDRLEQDASDLRADRAHPRTPGVSSVPLSLSPLL